MTASLHLQLNGFGQPCKRKRDHCMFKYSLPSLLLLCVVLTCSTANGQNLCPPGVASDKLICLIPQAFGVNQTLDVNAAASSQFKLDILSHSLNPLNTAVARESALLPLAS